MNVAHNSRVHAVSRNLCESNPCSTESSPKSVSLVHLAYALTLISWTGKRTCYLKSVADGGILTPECHPKLTIRLTLKMRAT